MAAIGKISIKNKRVAKFTKITSTPNDLTSIRGYSYGDKFFFGKIEKRYKIIPQFDTERSNKLLNDYLALEKADKLGRYQTLQNSLLSYYRNTESVLQFAILQQELGYTDDALKTYRRWKSFTSNKKPVRRIKVANSTIEFTSNNNGHSIEDASLPKEWISAYVKKVLRSQRVRRVVASMAIMALPFVGLAQNPNGVPTDQIYNQFQKPNIHSQYFGKGEYEYYASSDVNNNGIPGEIADAQAIRNGVVNDMADVNADGVVNELDAQMIENYANGNGKLIGIDYMSPEHTKEERREFILNLYQNAYIPSFETIVNSYGETVINTIPGWDCNNYTEQALHDFRGFTEPEGFVDKYWTDSQIENFRIENGARFNIQCDMGQQRTQSGINHSVIRFPIGNNLEDLNDWLTIDGQCGVDAGPGTRFYSSEPNKSVKIYWGGTTMDFNLNGDFPGQARGPPIIWYKTTTDGGLTIDWQNPDYHFTRPVNEAPVITSTIENSNFEYQSNLDLSPEAVGIPNVTDDNDPNPTLSFTESSTQGESGIDKYRYTLTRNWTATDNEGATGTLEEKLNVDDTTSPEFNVSSTYVKINQDDDPIVEAKKLVNYTYDNSEITDTLVNNTSGNFYDIKVRDIAGNVSETIEVEVDRTTGIVDLDGINGVIGLEMQNPITSASMFIKVNSAVSGIVIITITDIMGVVVTEKAINTIAGQNKVYFNFQKLRPGLYLFRVKDSKGNSDVRRIVKQ